MTGMVFEGGIGMGLLDVLKLPPRPGKAAGAAAPRVDPQAAELRKVLDALEQRVKALVSEGRRDAGALQKFAGQISADLDKGLLGGLKDRLKQLHKLASREVDAPEAPDSAVEAGAAETSLAEFQGELKSAIQWVARASKALKSTPGNAGLAKALKQFGDGLGQVADGLGKVKGAVAKVLAAAEAVRKLQQCVNALRRLRDVDLNAQPEEGARAAGEVAALFGQLGGELFKEVPGMNGYFTIIARSGEVFEMGARLHKKYDDMLDRTGKTDPPVDQTPEPAPRPKKRTGKVAVKDLPAFLNDNQQRLIDAFDDTWLRDAARKIRESGSPDFDGQHELLMAALKREEGTAHKVRDALHVTPKWAHDELRKAWTGCRAVIQKLEDEIGSRQDVDVSYAPALDALDAIKPQGA